MPASSPGLLQQHAGGAGQFVFNNRIVGKVNARFINCSVDPSDGSTGSPGKDVLSTFIGSGYATYSGTSMATPHVAGAVALMLAEGDATRFTR